MTTRRDARRLGIALHLLWMAFTDRGCWTRLRFKHRALRSLARMLLQALLDAGHGIRRHVHASIFAPFALHDLHGLLLPIDLLQLEVGHLGDPEATAEDHQKQRAVHRMGDLGKEPLDLLTGEGFGQGMPTPDKVTA